MSERHFAVKGTPTDCVIMAVRHILADKRPDLVLSGVNRGQNVAEDVTYSGTVAGAIEGTLLGIPSIALSQAYRHQAQRRHPWTRAETHGPDDHPQALATAFRRPRLINVNFPDREPDESPASRSPSRARATRPLMHIDERATGGATPITGSPSRASGRLDPAPGTDLWALDEGRISVTPLRLDMTDVRPRAPLAEFRARNRHEGAERGRATPTSAPRP